MVGRARERRRLQDAFDQAIADRSCQLFTVLGAAGVGKSRLVREFVAGVSGEAVVARGRCLPYGDGITYWPLLEAVWELASLDDVLPAEQNLAKLASVLEARDDAALVARRVGEVIGLSEESSNAAETFAAVRVLLEEHARTRPLVLVFDDIHWGEATFLDLVDHLADWIQDAPVLLVCIARPELLDVRPQWGGGKLNATAVRLEPLSDEESAELVDALAVSQALDGSQRRRIVEAASGNPLFVEEMLALLLDGSSGVPAAVPPTIQALLAARLDRLPDGERTVVEAAAVEGKLFHERSVAELTSISQPDLDAHLLALTRKELIRSERPLFSGERGYVFRHILIRDAAYESIPKHSRAGLHERYVGWLERQLGDRALEFDEILGYHLEQAHRYHAELGPLDDEARDLGRRAAERLGIAGRRAFLRSDAPAGVNLISRSAALLPPDDPFRVELVPNVRAVQGVSDLGWADRVLTEAIEAAATSGDRTLAAHALVQRGFLRLFTGSEVAPSELFDVAGRAIAIFETTDDELGLSRAWRLVAQAHYLDSDAAGCAQASERALVHARRAADRFEVFEIVEWLVIALLFGPTPAAEAYARCRALLEEEWDDFRLPTEISSAAATLAAMLGRTEDARDLVRRSRDAMAEAEEWVWIVTFWHSYISVWYGDPAAAEEELRPAYDALKRIGDASHFNSIAHALSNAVYLQGRYAEAEALTEECERASGPNDIYSQILWRSTRAKALARRGAFETARELAQEAVALGEASDFLLAHADALADLAEVLALEGRADDAEPVLEAAIRRYEDKGNVLAATAAQTWHARLGAG
jgi:tetratricopeptide (TPR) repeat protein